MSRTTRRPAGYRGGAQPDEPSNADLAKELKLLRDQIEVLARLACPHCSPALIAELHPETVEPAQVSVG